MNTALFAKRQRFNMTVNIAFSIAGQIVPLIVSFAAIPLIIAHMDAGRYGALSIMWLCIGYSSVYDLGLGRSLAKLVSEHLGEGRPGEVPAMVRTSLAAISCMGLGIALLAYAVLPWIAASAGDIRESLREEAVRSFRLLCPVVPLILMSAGMNGVLEAYRRFDLSNALLVVTGLTNVLGPLVASVLSSGGLESIAFAFLIGRTAVFLIYGSAIFFVIPGTFASIGLRMRELRRLFAFGAWVTVSNIVSHIMFVADRLFIGSLVSLAAVGYYSTPLDVIVKLLILPHALSIVMFPAFSRNGLVKRRHTGLLILFGTRTIAVILFPLAACIAAFAPELLRIWLGGSFAENTVPAVPWLLCGIFINALAFIPFTFMQSIGRPHVTAAFHCFELPVFIVGLWLLTGRFGIAGTSVAWMLRIALDTALVTGASLAMLQNRYIAAGLVPTMGLLILSLFGISLIVSLDTPVMVRAGTLVLSMIFNARFFNEVFSLNRISLRRFRARWSSAVARTTV